MARQAVLQKMLQMKIELTLEKDKELTPVQI
jgi:hypothetical protein